MINRAAIQQWSEHAPWIDNAQIEQDLIEELLGTKLRALYQRKKGRDLFDLYIALQR